MSEIRRSGSDSTTTKGDAFRDLVISHLTAAGFKCSTEVRQAFKKIDGRAQLTRDSFDGEVTYLIEAKDYAGTLPLDQCTKFSAEYGELIRRGEGDKAWLIASGPISPDGRAAVDKTLGLKCFTFEEFQRALLNVDGYLRDVIAQHRAKGIGQFYIRPQTEEGEDLEILVNDWINETNPPPLAVISGYGKGKSTFALHLAATMASRALEDKTARVPLLISLGDVLDVTGIDGLVSRVLTSTHRATNYHFHLFDELNRTGRFLIILDGFDEMKHGMTVTMFERAFMELMKFDQGDARVLILGRNTAFHNEDEFRSIVLGRQKTGIGNVITTSGRRECRPVSLREFTPPEVAQYVRAYFPFLLKQNRIDAASDTGWVEFRIDELLSPVFTDLIARPVHAQMLCEVATNRSLSLSGMTRLQLYDTFTHYLLEREVHKAGRDPNMPIVVRRNYNASVAWWLWEQGGATTASLDAIPASLATRAVGESDHDYDTIGLHRELAAGLLVEKSQTAVYFGHRSIQEFLVATHLLNNGLSTNADPSSVLKILNREIIDFLVSYFAENKDSHNQAREWLNAINRIRGKINSEDLALMVALARVLRMQEADFLKSNWMFWLGYIVLSGANGFYQIGNKPKGDLVGYLSKGWKEGPSHEAALLLTAIVLRYADRTLAQGLPKILAAWLPAEELADAVAIATLGKNSIAQIRKERSLRLWSFLQLFDVDADTGEVVIKFNYDRMHDLVDDINPGFYDITLVDTDLEVEHSCTAQSLYRALNDADIKESILERIRPFFNDQQLRGRIRPLVVEKRSRPALQRTSSD